MLLLMLLLLSRMLRPAPIPLQVSPALLPLGVPLLLTLLEVPRLEVPQLLEVPPLLEALLLGRLLLLLTAAPPAHVLLCVSILLFPSRFSFPVQQASAALPLHCVAFAS